MTIREIIATRRGAGGEMLERLRTYLGGRVEGPDLMYRTFEYSCQHLIEMWRNYEDADVMAMY